MGRKKKRVVTIFGSGHIEENFPEYQRAVLLGRVLAENGFAVCTGGYGGIMEAAPRGARQVGGETIAITSSELSTQTNRWMSVVKEEKTWRSRLFKLINIADAVVIFDGGTGTLTELFASWEMVNKKLMSKPIIIHGEEMIKLVKKMKRQRLILFNDCLRYANTPQVVLAELDELFAEEETD